MSDLQVHIVFGGWDCEGERVISVHSDLEAAQKSAKNIREFKKSHYDYVFVGSYTVDKDK